MAFKMIAGNRLEMLAAVLSNVLTGEETGVLEPVNVIVPSRGMGRWLAMEIAERLGVAANLKFPFLMTFVRKEILELLTDSDEEREMSQALSWRIRSVLPTLLDDPDFGSLRDYLQDEDGLIDTTALKGHQLADQLGDLFDAYMIQRPEWILDWDYQTRQLNDDDAEHDAQTLNSRLWGSFAKEQLEDVAWQKKLWNAVSADWKGRHFPAKWYALTKSSNPTTMRRLSKKFEGKTIRLFGFSSMPQGILDLFVVLGKITDVEFYYFSPCLEYWADAKPEKERLRLYLKEMERISRSYEGKSEEMDNITNADFAESAEAAKELFLGGNPLLGSYGKAGREFFTTLVEKGAEEYACYSDVEGESQLELVRKAILWNEPIEDPETAIFAETEEAMSDSTIQFHLCHSPMREVEVLHDELRRMFAECAELLPKDVFVMTPSLDVYAPLVEAVFNNPAIEESKRIPVSVADLAVGAGQQIPETMLKILKSSKGRFVMSEVFDIFGCPAVHAKFGLDADGFEKVREWAVDSGIRWGIDADDRAKKCGEAFDEASWRTGLDRMLLGYAMRVSSNETLIEDENGRLMSPFEKIEGKDGVALGALTEFVESLFSTGKSLSESVSLTMGEWEAKIGALLERFFEIEKDSDSAQGAMTVRKCLRKLASRAEKADVESANQGDKEPQFGTADVRITLDAIVSDLEKAFKAPTSEGGFLNGKVTLCRMMPMRSIPAKAICLIGMNHDAFPGQDRRPNFDLMSKKRMLGDRSKREEDRQLFLEALLSARERLYISYVGRGVRDNKERPASPVVDELRDYLRNRFKTISETVHFLQPFNSVYFDGSTPRSYSRVNLAAARVIAAERGEAIINGYRLAFVESLDVFPDEGLLSLSIDNLIKFYKHPADYFLKYRLKASPFEEQSAVLEDDEIFEWDHLQRYLIDHDLVEMLKTESRQQKTKPDLERAIARIEPILRAQGRLPIGVAGRTNLAEQIAEVADYALELANRAEGSDNRLELSFDSEWDDQPSHLTLSGDVTTKIQTLGRWASIKGRDRVELMIRHLAANAVEPTITTGLYKGVGGAVTEQKLNALLSPKEAQTKLRSLMEPYLSGLRGPLKFMPSSSWAWFEEPDVDRKNDRAESAWLGNYFASGEGGAFSFYFGETLPLCEEFEELAETIYGLVDWEE